MGNRRDSVRIVLGCGECFCLWGVKMKLKLKTHDDFKGGLGCDYPLNFESPGAYVTGDMIMIPGEDLIAAGWNSERTSQDGDYSFYLNRQCEVL